MALQFLPTITRVRYYSREEGISCGSKKQIEMQRLSEKFHLYNGKENKLITQGADTGEHLKVKEPGCGIRGLLEDAIGVLQHRTLSGKPVKVALHCGPLLSGVEIPVNRRRDTPSVSLLL